MNESIERFRKGFADAEYRYGYAESFLNIYIAAQIKALREERGWEQEDLATRMGTQQSGISRLENVNYSSWSLSTLKRLARIFGVRLKVSFEEFATLPTDVNNFDVAHLSRKSFDSDPVFGVDAPEFEAFSEDMEQSGPYAVPLALANTTGNETVQDANVFGAWHCSSSESWKQLQLEEEDQLSKKAPHVFNPKEKGSAYETLLGRIG